MMKRQIALTSTFCLILGLAAFAQQSPPVLQRRPADENSAPTPVYQPAPQPAEQQTQQQQYPPQQVQQQQYPQQQQQYPPQQYPQQGQNGQYQQYPQQYGPMPPNMVPAGATFIVRLDDSIDTSRLKPGKQFKAKLSEDLLAPNGAILIPRNKKIKGHVSSLDRGLGSHVMLSFDQIESNHGWLPLIASVNSVPGENGIDKVSEEGEISRNPASKRREIEAAGMGAAVGAASGAAWGGGKGAAIGAGAGAAVGATAGILTNRDMKLVKGQQIELRLDRDLRVPLS